MGQILLFTYGLPGSGKSELVRESGKVLVDKSYRFRIFNPGQNRRADPEYSWLRTSDHFQNNPAALQEISDNTLRRALEYIQRHPDENVVAAFDQTGTRRRTREFLWSAIDDETDVIFLDLYASSDISLERLRDKAGNGDYSGVSEDAAMADFRQRIETYRDWCTSYRDDCAFGVRRPAVVGVSCETGDITLENIQNSDPGVVESIVMGFELARVKFL